MEGEGAMERRIKIVGLCLVVIFALGAVIASGASATVQIGQCAKNAKKVEKHVKGHFKGKNCNVGGEEEATPEEVALGGTKNKYNWEAGTGANNVFVAKGHEMVLKSENLEIKCQKSSGAGAIRNAEDITVKFKFINCSQPKNAGKKCQTHNAAEAEIKTNELIGTISENLAKEVVFTLSHKGSGLSSEPEQPWVEYECNETKYTASGTLVMKSLQTAGLMVKKGGLEASELVGGQELESVHLNNLSEEEEEAVKLTFASSFKYEEGFEFRQTP
jgi:hypothetical protein